MKTYDERKKSIISKARFHKKIRITGKIVSSLFALLFVSATLWLFPRFWGSFDAMKSPTTQNSTNPDVTTPIADNVSISINPIMTVNYKDSLVLECSYSITQEVFSPGDTVSVTVVVKNVARKFTYTGSIQDQFGYAALLLDNVDDSFVIPQVETPKTDDNTQREFAHLETAQYTYQFVIPQDAPEGNYILEADVFGELVRFDSEAAKETKYIPSLFDLPVEAQKRIARDYGDESYEQRAPYVPIYGEFGDVYVTYYHSFGCTVVTSELVNGLYFQYGTNNKIQVFTLEKEYGLGEAFDLGILTAQQLQQVYDNYQLVGTRLPTYRYGPYAELEQSWIVITDWEKRLRYSSKNDTRYDYENYYPGDKVTIWVEVENIGPEFFFGRDLKDIFAETALLVADDGQFTIVSDVLIDNSSCPITTGWPSGIAIGCPYRFTIPEDVQKGHYTMIAWIFGQEIRFDAEIAEGSLNLYMLDDIPHEVKKMIWGDHFNQNVELMNKYAYLPLYGRFEDTYVYIYDGEPVEGISTFEIVNGLEFVYQNGYEMSVYKVGSGAFSLTEAFEQGILSSEQLQQVYDNYVYVNSFTFVPPQFPVLIHMQMTSRVKQWLDEAWLAENGNALDWEAKNNMDENRVQFHGSFNDKHILVTVNDANMTTQSYDLSIGPYALSNYAPFEVYVYHNGDLITLKHAYEENVFSDEEEEAVFAYLCTAFPAE